MDKMDEWIHSRLLFPKEIGDLAKDFQRNGRNAQANGLLVWLFTARAALYPDLVETRARIWRVLNSAPESSINLANELIAETNRNTSDPNKKLDLLEM